MSPPQHRFSWRNKKNINTFGLKKKNTSYQELWCVIWVFTICLGLSVPLLRLTLSMLGKHAADDRLKYFTYFSQKIGFDIHV